MSEERLQRIEKELEKLTRVIIGNGSGDGLHERVNQLYEDMYGGPRGREYSLFSQVGYIQESVETLNRDSQQARKELSTRIDQLANLFDDSHVRVVNILKKIRAAVISGVLSSLVVLIVVALISGNSETGQWLRELLVGLLGILG